MLVPQTKPGHFFLSDNKHRITVSHFHLSFQGSQSKPRDSNTNCISPVYIFLPILTSYFYFFPLVHSLYFQIYFTIFLLCVFIVNLSTTSEMYVPLPPPAAYLSSHVLSMGSPGPALTFLSSAAPVNCTSHPFNLLNISAALTHYSRHSSRSKIVTIFP